ncbi:virion RNA polymerase [Klebsiella phage KpCHEMY26]|uniref:RNA polymerase n=1 Tax=Klebsiella phage KpCHEMY26 TaxID=2596966 RepID=A0A5B8R7F2_9CAUD|nr:virion RNA polymerase [Klebsiella phage KpCHEMY26]QEA03295.1 RNA polymerase [Klebsiella phage KpCHEMY26]
MATGFEKEQQLSGVGAQKAQELNQATQQKRVEMGAPVPGVEIDFPVGSPGYQRAQEAIRLAEAGPKYTREQMTQMLTAAPTAPANTGNINDFSIPEAQPITPEMQANYDAIARTKPFYRKMINPQVSPEFGGTGPFDPNHPNYQAPTQQAQIPANQQYLEDLQYMPMAALQQKYGPQAARDKLSLNIAKANTDEFSGQGIEASDIGNAAQVWLGNTARFATGLGNLALQNTQDLIADVTGRDDLAGQPTLLDQAGIDKPLKEFTEEQRGQYSPGILYEQSVIEAQKEQFKNQGAQREAADIAKGDNPLVAGAKEQLRQFVNTAEQYGDKPGALTTLIAESAPDLLTGGLVGKLATRGAFKELVKEYGEDFATKLAATKYGREKLQDAAENAFVGYVGFQEAGSNMQQTLDQIDGMTNAQLAEKSPMYRDLIAEGMSEEQARRQVRTQAGNVTAAVAGTLGALTGKLAAPFESRIFSPSLLEGTGFSSAASRILGNTLRETVEEASQGATGQFGSNLGVRTSADESQSLSEDIGSNVAESALAGAGMGAFGSAVSETPRAIQEGIQQGRSAFNERQAQREQTRAQDFRNTVNTANESVQQTSPQPDTTATTEAAPATKAVDAVTEPAAKEVFKAIPEEEISSPGSILRIARAIRNRQLDEASRRDLATVGNNVISAYEEALPNIQAQMQSAPEEQKAQYQTAIDNINAVLSNPDVQAIKTTAESFKLTPDEMTKVMESLPSEITPETYQSPEVQQGVKSVLAQMNLDAASITPETADKLINSADAIGLSQQDLNKLRVISATGKAMSQVGQDVRQGSDGFIGIQQYQQGIFRALALNDTKRAQGLLDHLNRFATHMETKADAFEQAAQNFTGNRPVEVINPTTGQPYMSLDGNPMTYHPVRSKNLVQEIRNDAAAVRQAHTITGQLVDGKPVDVPAQSEPMASEDVNSQEQTPAPEATSEEAPVETTSEQTSTEAPTEASESTNQEEVQTPAETTETQPEAVTEAPAQVNEEPVQGELFDKPETVESDIQIQEEPTSVETDLMDESQLDLGLEKGVNYDILNGLQTETVRSDAKSTSDVDKEYQATNQVKKWFKPTGKRSAFLRTSNFSGRLNSIFTNGSNPITQIQNLFKGFINPEQVTAKEVSVLRQFAGLVPAVEQSLIQSWGKLTPEGQRIFWETYPVEYFDEVRNINGENVYFLPQPVIEAMTAGMMQWFVRNASETLFNDDRAVMDILGLDNKTRPTVEQVDLLRDVGTDRQNIIDDLSREIFGILGITADPNTPISVRDTVSKALAAEVLNVMINAGLVQETVVKNSELAAVGSIKVNSSNIKNSRVFIKMNPESEASLQLVKLMEDSNDLLGQLTNPSRERANAFFDVPPKGQSTKVKNGGGQDIPEKMLAARNKASKQPHFINVGLHDLLLDKLGIEWTGRMLGIQSEENANGAHLKSIQGSNRTIERDINTLVNGLTRMVEAGKDLATTPIYFAYNVISNYRMMLNSGDLNPQSAKLHRELVTVAPSTIELNNPLHGAFLDYAIAQGLDISIDKLSSNTARERLNKAIDTGLFRDAINILKAAEIQDSISDADAETLLQAVNAGKEKTKTLHALYAQAQYELAVEQGKESFQTHIMLELDGVTNGPFNSIIHLGLKDINQDLLDKLEKGGLFYGQSDRLYNDAAEEPGFLDLYKTAAAGTQEYVNNMMDSVRNIPNRIAALSSKSKRQQQKELREIERLKNQMRVTLAASKLIGDVNIVEGEDVEHPIQIGRGLLKNPVTVTVYSGGANAINRKIAMGIVNGYYEAITEALRAVDSATTVEERDAAIAHIQDLTQTTNELTSARVFRNGDWVNIGEPINLGSDVTQFKFSGEQIDAITQNIKIGIGAAVNQSIATEFGTVVKRGKMMVYAAAVMHEVFMSRWNKEVSRLEEELRKAGKLSKFESLSQQQYNDIKQYLIGSMPIFNSWFTANNLDVDQLNTGILLSEEARQPVDNYRMESRGRRELDGKMRRSTFGVDMPTYTEPGTRVMPLLVQSVEAAMQAIARDINPNNALNVFDGYINAVEHLESGSQAINQGVFQSWNEFDLLQDFTNRFEQAMEGVDVDAELDVVAANSLQQSFDSIAEDLGLEPGIYPISPEILNDFLKELKKEAATQTAIKQGLLGGEAITSINQMTGANIPFNVQNGKQVTEQTDELIDTRTPLEQLVANTELPTVESISLPLGRVTIPPSRQMAEALDRNGRTLRGHEGVKVLAKGDVVAAVREAAKSLPSRQNKITGFILDKIEKAIPNDINVYVGSPEALSDVQWKLNPGRRVKFTSNFLGLTEGQNIYIGSQSIETVMHELIHAATANTVQAYYTDPASLTPNQRTEVASIEALMTKFVNEYTYVNPETNSVVSLINDHIESGDMAQATAEFIAWGLVNPRMIDAMTQKTVAGKVTNVLKQMADAIKRLFAIGSNPEINSYWSRLLGHTVALTDTTTSVSTADETSFAQRNANNINRLDAETLFNKLNPGKATQDHINHLTDTLDYLQSNIVRVIKQSGQQISGLDHFQEKLLVDSIDPEIDKSPDALIAHGFDMSEKEAFVFKMLQVSMKYGLENFSPSVLVARSLYAQARDQLKVSDFLTDPNNTSATEMALAKQRYDAVFGNTAITTDATGRTNRLANFIALAETHEPLRNKLAQMSVKRTRSAPASTIREHIGDLVNSILTWLSGLATKSLSNATVATRLTKLAKNISHVDSEARDNLLGRVERGSEEISQTVQDKLNAFGHMVRNQLLKVQKIVPKSVAFGINAGSAVFNDQDAQDVRTAITTIMMNIHQNGKLGTLAELVNEFIGSNETNQTIHTLLTQKNMAADRARQIIREMVPGMIEQTFVSLNQTEKEAIQKVVANTDMAYLFANGYSLARLNELLTNPNELAKEIASMESQLNSIGAQNAPFYIKSAKGLAKQMVHGVSPLVYQLPNAASIARLIGTGKVRPNDTVVNSATQLIDTLASLSALTELSQADKETVSNVISREMTKGEPNNNGMTFTLKYYSSLQGAELAKSGKNQSLAAVKGYTPTLTDPNKKVIVASVLDEPSLVRRGYVRGAQFARDPNDLSKEPMYYYHSNNGGEPRWIAGVMSTLQTTVGGVNPISGRSVNGSMTPGIWGSKEKTTLATLKRGQIDDLFDANKPMPTGFSSYMQPTLNRAGSIMGYSYQIPRANKEAHLDIDNDFTKVMAAWEGRIAEEIQAEKYNEMLLQRLREMYVKDARQGNAYQYITINKNSTDPQLKEIYELMPIEMKEAAKEIWPNGDIKVRKDLLNNAFGYREPSVLNMWTGQTGYSKEFQKAFVSIAETFLGKNAAKYLRLGERGIMEFVKEMKDWIVVRSVVVSAANIVSNMVHLATVGVSPVTMAKDMSVAVLAAEEYRRNEKLINEYSHYLAVGHNPKMADEYQRKISELKDSQARNPVADLIKAGLLPTIAEDLGQQDDYSLKDKLLTKMDEYTSAVPDSVKRVAKEVALSRDSHIYFLLNRSIQYGDFVAKYSLYKQLTTRKNNPMDKDSAIARVMDEFVNYDILPSRTRFYLDAMGLTWFLNYKIRIQKVILRTIRENPLRALFLMFSNSWESNLPNITDANLVTGSLNYNIGFGTALNGFTVHPLVELY